MEWLLKRKQVISSLMIGAIVFSFFPSGGIEAAPIQSKVEGVSVFSSVDQQPVSSNSFNLIQKSPIFYAAAAGTKEQRVIVTFKDKKKINKSLIQKGKGKVKRENKHTPSLSVSIPANEIEALKNDPAVESVEPDIQLQTASTQIMDWGVSVVNATYAWSNGYTGKGVKVAVLDSGIDTHHEDLAVAGGVSFVDYTTSFDDDFGHGTHVAGIIGAKNNDVGVVGVAPAADLYAVKVLDSKGKGYLSDVIAGIDWAVDNKMDIINMSMTTSVDSPALHKAVDQAYASGLLLVAAAGNTGNAEGTGDTIQYPAKYSSVIAVGAVDQFNQRASFSATGEDLEVVAPGVGIKSTHLNSTYSITNGTSVATPFVVGALAILKEQYPDSEAKKLRQYLDQDTIQLNSQKSPLYGYGLSHISSSNTTVISPTIPSNVSNEDVLGSVYGIVYAAVSPTGSFSETSSFSYNMYYPSQSTLNDGRIFIHTVQFQQVGTTNSMLNKAIIYNPTTNSWSFASDAPSDLSVSQQSTLKDGRVLLTSSQKAYIYDPSANNWTQVAKVPREFGREVGNGAQSTLNDGRVLVTGGGGVSGSSDFFVKDSYLYNPTTNTWSKVASLPMALKYHKQSTLSDGRVLVTGGSVLTDTENGSQLPFYRTYIYDPISNTWNSGPDLPTAMEKHGQSTLPDGKVLVTGWNRYVGGSNSSVYLFNPASNSWSTLFDLPVHSSSAFAQSTLPDGRVVITGGQSYSPYTNKHFIFNINYAPKATINNDYKSVWDQAGNNKITLTGTFSDLNNDTVSISAKIANVTKTVSISNTASNQTWSLQWDMVTDQIPSGIYTSIPVTFNDAYETTSITYTGSTTVDRMPNLPGNTLPGNLSANTPEIIQNITPTLTWTFSDVDAGDSQTAYEVSINNGASQVYDSGWINSSSTSFTVPDKILNRGTTYNWSVRVKDSKGISSLYSSPKYFKTNNQPSLVVLSPINGQTFSDNILNFTWNYNDSDNQPQVSYQVIGSKDNWATREYDSGTIISATTTHKTSALTSGGWNFAIRVFDNYEWSNWVYITNLSIPSAYEPNDSTTNAFVINYNQTIASNISTATDIDYFKYIAPLTGVDRVTMSVPSGLNYDVYILDSNSNQIASSTRGTGFSENVLFDVTAGSTYFIKIIGVGGSFSTTSSYSINVNKLTLQVQTNYQYDSNGNITNKTTTSSN